MKCPSCGAEIQDNEKFCEFCGSEITSKMRREREKINKSGCPRCGSSNITFNREKMGEVKGKKGSAVVRATIGVCKDCGYTWQTAASNSGRKKSPMWLWVLGWIFCFPIPLTVLIVRQKQWKPLVRGGLIAALWIIVLLIGSTGGSDSKKTEAPETATTATTDSIVEPIPDKEEVEPKTEATSEEAVEAATEETTGTVSSSNYGDDTLYADAFVRPVMNGSKTEKIGEISVAYVRESNVTEEKLADWYYNYVTQNDFNWCMLLYADSENFNDGVYAINGMVEKDVHFEEDGNIWMLAEDGESNAIIYVPTGDGKTLKVME